MRSLLQNRGIGIEVKGTAENMQDINPGIEEMEG